MEWAPKDTTIKDLVVALLALWGAGLSTYSFFATRRRKVRVVLSAGISDMGEFVIVTATNNGSRPVTIRYLTIELADKRTLVPGHSGMPDTPLPISLSDGQFCHCYFRREDVKSAVRRAGFEGKTKLRGLATDGVGADYRGKPTHWDV